MIGQSSFNIRETKDKVHIEICARIMSATDPWIRYGMDLSLCLKSFEGDFRDIYILEIDQQIVGFAVLQMKGTFKGYIQTLCIREDRRGQGLGRKLLEFCEEKILKISPNIFICVSKFNEGAFRLYKDFGFELIGSLQDFLKPGITELLMRKTYGPIIDFQTNNLQE